MYVNVHIKTTNRIFPRQGRKKYLRLDMNENPQGLPEDFVSEVLAEITPEFLATYPEPEHFRQRYAKYIGAAVENVAVTNGTDMAIRYIMETFGETGKDVVTVTPSFEMYRINCSILGLRHTAIHYNDDFTVPVGRLCNAITDDTRIVVLLNPNNPMGDVYSPEDFARIQKKAASVGALVLVDEAYHYFCPTSFLPVALDADNVLVTRSFSKLFSMPACRLGIVAGHPKLIHYLRNGQLSFDVNSFALLFGERLLQRQDIIDDLIKTERGGRDRLEELLRRKGYSYIHCAGNYTLIRTRMDPRRVEMDLEKKCQILVHSYREHSLLEDYIRVSTGEAAVMEYFMDALEDVDRAG